MIRILISTFLLIIGSFLLLNEKKLLFDYLANSTSNVRNKKIKTLNYFDKNSPINQSDFYNLFEVEMIQLREKLDGRLFKVKSIKWNIHDPEIEIEKLKVSKSFQLDQESSLNLEVEIFSQNDGYDKTIIAQFNYTDFETKNKVHEFSRMFKILDKKKPD